MSTSLLFNDCLQEIDLFIKLVVENLYSSNLLLKFLVTFFKLNNFVNAFVKDSINTFSGDYMLWIDRSC